MAPQISSLISYAKAVPCVTGPVLRVWGASQRSVVKFIHTSLTSATPRQLGRIQAQKFSTSAAFGKSTSGQGPSSPLESRSWLAQIALGVTLGVSSAALTQSLYTGRLAAMAPKVNLNSTEGDWNETKAFLLSVKDKRPYYRTSKYVPLEDIPVWSPTTGDEKGEHPGKPEPRQKISLFTGDITTLEIDAIVNAANKSLLGGGGVDGAIHRAAGPMLKKECASLNGCETGQAKITCAYGLPAKYVIHTVGPIAHGQVGETEKTALRSCYKNSLQTAVDHGARSVAFPCISTGIYGYPPHQAVHEALATVRDFLHEHNEKLDRVIFCVFLRSDEDLYLRHLPHYFPSETAVKSKL